MNMDKETIEAGVAAVASKTTYTGAGAMVLGWVTSNEFAVLFGLIVGVAGLCVNWYYKAKADRRADREHALRVQRLTRGQSSDTDLGELGVDE